MTAMLCALAWGTSRLGEWLRPSIERVASKTLGLPTHIDAVRVGLLPPRVEAEGIEIGEVAPLAQTASAWVRVQSLQVTPHPGSLLVMWPVLASVQAKGVIAEVVLPPQVATASDAQAPAKPPFDPKRFALPFDVRAADLHIERLHVRQLAAEPNQPETYLTSGDLHIVATPTGWRERTLKSRSPSVLVGVRHGGSPQVFAGQLDVDAVLHGSLRRPRHLEVQRARLTGPDVRVDASGEGRLDGPDAPASAHLSAKLSGRCDWLHTLWPDGPVWRAWRGARASLELRTVGTWRAQSAQFSGELAAPQVADVAAIYERGTREGSAGSSGVDGTLGTSGDAGGGASTTSGPRGTSGISGAGGTSSNSGGTSAEEGGLSEFLDISGSFVDAPQRTPAGAAPATCLVRGRLEEGRVRLDEARLCLASRCPLTATGEWRVGEPFLSMTLEATRLPLAEMAGALSLSLPWPVQTSVSGQSAIDVQWPHHTPRVRAQLDWRLGTTVLQRPIKEGKSHERLVGLLPARLRASVSGSPQQLMWKDCVLSVGDDELQMEGEWHSTSAGAYGLSARVWTDGFELGAISPIAKVFYQGRLTLGGSIEASHDTPLRIRTSTEAERLSIGAVHIGHVEGQVSLERGSLWLRNLVNTRGAGRLQGDVAMHFAEPLVPLEATISAERIEADDLLADLHVPTSVASRLSATLWGSASVRGTLAQPQGSARLETPRLSVAGLELGRAQITVKGHEGRTRLSGTLATRGERGVASAAAAIDDDGEVHARLSATEVPLKTILPKLSHRAALTVRLALDGPKDALDGTLTAFVSRPPAAGVTDGEPPQDAALVAAAERAGEAAGGMSLMVRAQRGVANFDVHALEGALVAHGQLQLKRALQLDLRGELRALEARELTPWIPQFEGPSRQLGLSVDGTFAITGPAAEWHQLSVRLHLASLGGRLVGAPIALGAPVTLVLRNGLFEVPHLELKSRALSATLEGLWRLWPASQGPRAWQAARAGEALQLKVALAGDVAALGPWVPALTAAKGSVKAGLSLQGALERPLVFGEAEITNGAMRIGIGDQPLEHVALKLVFSGRAMALTVGHASVGRGRVHLQGEWSLGNGTWLDPRGNLSVRTRLEHVPFRPIPDLSSRLTGHIELTGEREALKLQGDVRVETMRYTARLDLDRLLRKRRAPPLKATFLPFARPVTLGIKLRAQNDAIVSSKLLEAELSGDLLLTGTSDRVGLLGSVTPLWARARYRDNIFVISRATVDFTDEYRIAPVYSIEGRTRACQIDTSVVVQGDSEGYSLTPSGRDEHGMVDAQDVLSCLHLGVRLSDFAGTYGHTAGFGDALSGSLDALWTVSGLDEKVRKFLPIRVDELRLTSGWSSINQRTTPRVVVGRELGRRVALRYVRSIDEISDQAFTLETKIDPTKTMQLGYMSARDVPTGDFGVDLRLHWELQ